MKQSRRNLIKGLGAAGAGLAAASVNAAVWTRVSPSGAVANNTWKKVAADVSAGGVNKWRKLGTVAAVQVANCSGYLPNGYCAGNPLYTPPSGTWNAWGLGFVSSNPSGYTGGLVNCSTVTVGAVAVGGNWNYCNCGTFSYINCNCNCNCANCYCGGFCCFPKGTQVRLPDGTKRAIEQVEIGARLAALHGVNTVEDLLICVVNPGDTVFRVNGQVECTWEQLFLGLDGVWLAVSEEGYRAYRARNRLLNPEFGLPDASFRQMVAGDTIHMADGAVVVAALDSRVVQEQEELHSFVTDGSRTFYANDFLVESRVSSDCFDFSTL